MAKRRTPAAADVDAPLPSPEAGDAGPDSRLRRALRGWPWIVVAIIGTVLLWPAPFGGSMSYVVVGGQSMEPSYHTGDLAVVRKTDSPQVGDVIVYRVPAGEPGEGGNVIHRLIGGDEASGYLTQGDNRDRPDMWRPHNRDVIGTVRWLVPNGGLALRWLFSPLALCAVAAGFLMWVLWPRDEDEAEDEVQGEVQDEEGGVQGGTDVAAADLVPEGGAVPASR